MPDHNVFPAADRWHRSWYDGYLNLLQKKCKRLVGHVEQGTTDMEFIRTLCEWTVPDPERYTTCIGLVTLPRRVS